MPTTMSAAEYRRQMAKLRKRTGRARAEGGKRGEGSLATSVTSRARARDPNCT